MRLHLREAEEHDIEALARLHAAAVATGYQHIFPESAPKPTAASLSPAWNDLVLSDAVVTVAEAGATVVGSVALVTDDSVPAGQLLKRLHVLPELWGQGIGALLHDHTVELATERGRSGLNLWVLEENHRARTMYERRGWTLAEPRRLFANDPIDIVDVLYTLPL